VLSTLLRAGSVLDLFTVERAEWGTTAAARELGIAKSQAHALLLSLSEIGLLARVGPGRYRLGWRVVSLNAVLSATADLRQGVAEPMRRLAERSGETVQLAAWGGDRAVCIAGCAGAGAAVTPMPVGAILPAHCTGPGKVLLASRSEREVLAVLSRDGLAEQTHDELAAVRRRGFAYDDDGHATDVRSVAAPIVAGVGVLAAVSLSVPVARWARGRDHYTRALVRSASLMSRLVADGDARGRQAAG
jgi:DNA-binding IclR family transcriptional regulator